MEPKIGKIYTIISNEKPYECTYEGLNDGLHAFAYEKQHSYTGKFYIFACCQDVLAKIFSTERDPQDVQ